MQLFCLCIFIARCVTVTATQTGIYGYGPSLEFIDDLVEILLESILLDAWQPLLNRPLLTPSIHEGFSFPTIECIKFY